MQNFNRTKQPPRNWLRQAAGGAPLRGLHPDIDSPDGLSMPGAVSSLWLGAACKAAEGAPGVGHV